MSEFDSAMSAATTISNKYFSGEVVSIIDFDPIIQWVRSFILTIKKNFTGHYKEAKAKVNIYSAKLADALSPKGILIADRVGEVLALLVAVFNYLKSIIC